MKRLAIIPARGGSKRIPRKNLRDFCGKPMISHVLDTAAKSNLFNVIHVSTDDNEISSVATQYGFPPDFARPEFLADDVTPIMPVLRYVVEEYAKRDQKFDEIWLIMACAPLITENDLVQAAKLFGKSDKRKALLAVSEYQAPIEWAFSRSEDGTLIPEQSGMFAVRSQDLEKKYFDAGSFAAFFPERITNSTGAGSDEGFVGFVLPKGSAIDIDEEQDWKQAEAIFLARSERLDRNSRD
ncbi:cytidylyltransferase domain-containing protein [Thalassospira xiamenensis]|uniref:acylneuraminate cytidylyltransferase family protein n=1 Tax=Thalassospira xiamenensis TaxID=220697 RepID=UPI003AA8C08E